MQTVIIERWAILRHGLGVVVRQGHPEATVADADTGTEGISIARSHGAGLAIVGQVPDMASADVVGRIRESSPGAAVVALLDSTDALNVKSALSAGADAVLSRSTDADELTDVLSRVGRGERVLSSELVAVLAGVANGDGALEDVDLGNTGLTRREGEILRYLSKGVSNRAIAGALFIGESTVKTHLAKIYDKLGVAGRHQAVARTLELGVLNGRSPAGP
jgi:DNA-binding NarL/FixJ family response regulator